MGTMIHLSVGAYQVDWGKNSGFINHSQLFQEKDLKPEVPDYGYSPPLMMEGYSKPLGEVVGRLELLGYTLDAVKKEYAADTEDSYGFPVGRALSFRKFQELIKTIDLHKFTGEWTESEKPNTISEELAAKLENHDYRSGGKRPDYWDLDLLLSGLSPYAQLRILAENPANLDVPVIWPFGELVDAGWATREEMLVKPLPRSEFLIVTEGSSDSKILEKALKLLRPDYAELFRFIDMEEGYPFTGTGNLFKFSQGLVSIGIQNQVIILYDNDVEGVSNYLATKKLSLPPNMVVARLPDHKYLKKMNTVGPHGKRKADINGTAASIECYLDLEYKAHKPALIRWSAYLKAQGKYQGALEEKGAYMKTFLKLRKAEPGYDFTKMEAVLDHLYDLSVGMVAKRMEPWFY